MNTKKQQCIKDAYGEYWEYFKDKLFDDNGYAMFTENEDRHIIWNKITLDSHPWATRVYRPKSLQCIETNNNWIIIESEDDRNYYGWAWVRVCREDIEKIHCEFVGGCIKYHFATHYMPISTPSKPLY